MLVLALCAARFARPSTSTDVDVSACGGAVAQTTMILCCAGRGVAGGLPQWLRACFTHVVVELRAFAAAAMPPTTVESAKEKRAVSSPRS